LPLRSQTIIADPNGEDYDPLAETLPPTQIQDLAAAEGAVIYVLSADAQLLASSRAAFGDACPLITTQSFSDVLEAVTAGECGILLLDADLEPCSLQAQLQDLDNAHNPPVLLLASSAARADLLDGQLNGHRADLRLIKPCSVDLVRLRLSWALGRLFELNQADRQPERAPGRVEMGPQPLPSLASDIPEPFEPEAVALATQSDDQAAAAPVLDDATPAATWREPVEPLLASKPDVPQVPVAEFREARRPTAAKRPASKWPFVLGAVGLALLFVAIASLQLARLDTRPVTLAQQADTTADAPAPGTAESAPRTNQVSPELGRPPPQPAAAASEQTDAAARLGAVEGRIGGVRDEESLALLGGEKQLGGPDTPASLGDRTPEAAALTPAAANPSEIPVPTTAGAPASAEPRATTRLADPAATTAAASDTPTPADTTPGDTPAPRSELDDALALAAARLRADQLLQPVNDSANHYLQQAARLGPNNGRVSALRKELAAALVRQADSALDAGDLESAERSLTGALDAGADAEAIAIVSAALADAQRAQAQQGAVRRVDQLLEAGRLIEPPQDNAWAVLEPMWAMPPAHPEWLATLGRFQEALASEAERRVAAADWPGTERALAVLIETSFDASRVGVISNELSYNRHQTELLANPVPLQQLPVVSSKAPRYPRRAQQRGIEGWVDLSFVVNEEGLPESITVIGAEPPEVFDEAVVAALSDYRFEPYEQDGRLYRRAAQTRVSFALTD
jgi:TonB family protein